MKKILYVFAIATLIISCSDDDTPIVDDDPIAVDDTDDDQDDTDDNDAVQNVVFDENVDGDVSNDNTAPTAVALAVGDNRVIADQVGDDPRDIDYLVVTVSEGFQLSELILDEYRADDNNPAFLGFVEGNTFPVDVANDGNPEPSVLLGGIVYGDNNVGNDILSIAGELDGAIGFEGALAAGEYTFWFNQTGASSGGTFNFVIEEATPPPTVADVVFDENVDGDISNDNTAPTAITLAVGDNRVIADQASDPRDIDYFVVTVPEGFQLSELILDEYRADDNNPAFLGFVEGSTFPVDVAADGNPEPSVLLGGIVYGDNNVGNDILSTAGELDGAIGFEGALAAGEYTFWLNQTGASSGGTFNFVIEAEEETEATIFSGPAIQITKAPNADFTLPENQDMITQNVIITRGNTMGLFNIAQESSFAGGRRDSPSPVGTEWAVGSTTDDLSTLNFMTWGQAVANPPQAVADETNYVLHLIEENIFIDVVFTSWSQGGAGGGGFSYERSTPEE